MIKRIFSIIVAAILLTGCSAQTHQADISATTLPVYEFTECLCSGTGLTVHRLIDQSVSCLHDYTLDVTQVRNAEASDLIVVSGAGLEDFMDDMIAQHNSVDASSGIALLHSEDDDHAEHDHDHEDDPHIWLSPRNAKLMAQNICDGLSRQYPQFDAVFSANLQDLLSRLDTLQAYGDSQLSTLRCRQLITLHDGFSYFADAFNLEILAAVEEESGSEASAKELINLISLVENYSLPAIFTEKEGSPSAASVIAAETGTVVFSLDMAMSGSSYFDAMYHNIDTIKEALG